MWQGWLGRRLSEEAQLQLGWNLKTNINSEKIKQLGMPNHFSVTPDGLSHFLAQVFVWWKDH